MGKWINVGNPIGNLRKTHCGKRRSRSLEAVKVRGQPNNKLLAGGMISGTYRIMIMGPNDDSLGQWSMAEWEWIYQLFVVRRLTNTEGYKPCSIILKYQPIKDSGYVQPVVAIPTAK